MFWSLALIALHHSSTRNLAGFLSYFFSIHNRHNTPASLYLTAYYMKIYTKNSKHLVRSFFCTICLLAVTIYLFPTMLRYYSMFCVTFEGCFFNVMFPFLQYMSISHTLYILRLFSRGFFFGSYIKYVLRIIAYTFFFLLAFYLFHIVHLFYSSFFRFHINK